MARKVEYRQRREEGREKTIYEIKTEETGNIIAEREADKDRRGIIREPLLRTIEGKTGNLLLPAVQRIPDPKELNSYTDAELQAVLQQFNVIPDWSELIAKEMPKAARAADMAYSDENLQRLLDEAVASTESLKQEVKEAYRDYMVARIVDGDPNQLLVRVSEGDDAVCEICAAKAGEVGTYAYHAEIGLIGTDCDGRDRCRCIYMATDMESDAATD